VNYTIQGVEIPCTTKKDREMAGYIKESIERAEGTPQEARIGGIFRKMVEDSDLLTWAYYTVKEVIGEMEAEAGGAEGR